MCLWVTLIFCPVHPESRAWCSSRKHTVFPAVHAPGAELILLSSFSLGFVQQWHTELHGRQSFCSTAIFRTRFHSAFRNTIFLSLFFRQNVGKLALLNQQQWCNHHAGELQPTCLLQGATHPGILTAEPAMQVICFGKRGDGGGLGTVQNQNHSSSALVGDGAELASSGPNREVWNLLVKALLKPIAFQCYSCSVDMYIRERPFAICKMQHFFFFPLGKSEKENPTNQPFSHLVWFGDRKSKFIHIWRTEFTLGWASKLFSPPNLPALSAVTWRDSYFLTHIFFWPHLMQKSGHLLEGRLPARQRFGGRDGKVWMQFTSLAWWTDNGENRTSKASIAQLMTFRKKRKIVAFLEDLQMPSMSMGVIFH